MAGGEIKGVYVVQSYYADEVGWDDMTSDDTLTDSMRNFARIREEETCEVRLIERWRNGERVLRQET
jgi:hypothetical protein